MRKEKDIIFQPRKDEKKNSSSGGTIASLSECYPDRGK